MNALFKPTQNKLLVALPSAEYARLAPYLELVQVNAGDCIHEPGDNLRYAYFPTTCILSLLYILENGTSAEIAMVGNEGVVGVALFMGSRSMPNHAVVLNTGYAYRVQRQQFIQEFNQKGVMLGLLLRYTQALITQMAQTAVCNRHHSLDQQLCHWILLNLDRLPGKELSITHELIANNLGVRRESVTEVAGKLQRAGLIEYHRGHITVLDRPKLEERVCECYKVVKTEFDRLLPGHNQKESSPAHIRAVNTLKNPYLLCS